MEKATAAAHARQRVTFHPQAETSEKRPMKEAQKLKRRVSLGVAVNAETGEVIEGGTRQRQSQRSHTIMNTSATVNRMKDAEEKRVSLHLTSCSTHFTVPPAGHHSEESKSSHEGTNTGRTYRAGPRHRGGKYYRAPGLSQIGRRETGACSCSSNHP